MGSGKHEKQSVCNFFEQGGVIAGSCVEKITYALFSDISKFKNQF